VKRIMLVVVVAALAFPGSAWADAGSITNVVQSASPAYPGDLGQASATYTSTSTTCTDYSFCGWYPWAAQVPAEAACPINPPDSTTYDLTYVGNYQDASGTQSGTDSFYPKWSSVRLCLYISSPDGTQRLVAQTTYTTVPGSTTTPPPPPPSTPPPSSDADTYVAPMGVKEARSYLAGVLRHRYGKRFTRRRGRLQRFCYRISSEKVRCRVGWNYTRYRYSGSVTLWNDPAHPATKFISQTKVRRKLTRRAAPQRVAATPPRASCDPNYSGCLDPNAYDYDCAGGSGDGPRYTGLVRVIGNDHYDLDRDGDGVACDDASASTSRVRGRAEALRARERAAEALRSAAASSRRK
jgi:hypothetical protein